MTNILRVFSCSCLWGWRTQTPVRRQWLWVYREGEAAVQHPGLYLRPPPPPPHSSTPLSPPLWPAGGDPEFAPGAGWPRRPSAEHFRLLTHTHAAWSADKHALVTTAAFHQKPVQILQCSWNFVIYTLFDSGIRRCGRTAAFPNKRSCPASPAGHCMLAPSSQNRRKWPRPVGNSLLHCHVQLSPHVCCRLSGRSHLSKYSTSASMWYWSASRWRNLLTEVSLSLTPCCLSRIKEKWLHSYAIEVFFKI